MKFLAFVLAFLLGTFAWSFIFMPFALARQSHNFGVIVTWILVAIWIAIVRFLYKFFLRKFGYDVVTDDKSSDDDTNNLPSNTDADVK